MLPCPFHLPSFLVSDVFIPLSDWDVSLMRSVCSCSCFGCYFGGNGLPPPFCFCFCGVSPPLVLFLVTFLTSNIPCLMLITSPFRLFHLYIAIVIFLFSTQEYFVSFVRRAGFFCFRYILYGGFPSLCTLTGLIDQFIFSQNQ